VDAVQYILPAHFAYARIPSESLRHFVDSLFPGLAKDSIADFVTGYGHRFKHGHDLLVDVGNTWKSHGFSRAAHQAGHIIFTDLPTKAGIPLPGLSANGLGEWLSNTLNVSEAWFCINISKAGISVLAVPEATMDLMQAAAGELLMNSVWTFLDTFGEGAVEIVLGYATHNPFLLAAGAGEMLAGMLAIVNAGKHAIERATILIPDPFAFFGAGLFSAILGFAISGIVTGGDMVAATETSLRSGLIGALCALSLPCGMGAALGFAAYAYGQALARQGQDETYSGESLRSFMDEIVSEFPDIRDTLALAEKNLLATAEIRQLASSTKILSANDAMLSAPEPAVLPASGAVLIPGMKTLRASNSILPALHTILPSGES